MYHVTKFRSGKQILWTLVKVDFIGVEEAVAVFQTRKLAWGVRDLLNANAAVAVA